MSQNVATDPRVIPTELPRADIFPSSLTREIKGHIWNAELDCYMVPIFCANCGCDGGAVPEPMIADGTGWVGYLCDSCAKKWAPLTGTMLIPDEVFWEKVNAAMVERYGRIMEPDEIERELADPNSMLTKLARERPKRG